MRANGGAARAPAPTRVRAAQIDWHLVDLGPPVCGRPGDRAPVPVVLLLHGTGSSADSWLDVAQGMTKAARVLVPDLPGHARSSRPPARAGASLPGMAAALAELLRILQCTPTLLVGHSAGAAVALRLALDWNGTPAAAVVGVNAALLPPEGLLGAWYSPLARLLAAAPGAAPWFARRASQPEVMARLLTATGSQLGDSATERYRRLVTDPAHVAAALDMMAQWDLRPLLNDLPRLTCSLHLIATAGDRTVPATQSERVAAMLERTGGPRVTLDIWPRLGHLAHEEDPAAFAGHLLKLLEQHSAACH